MPESDPTKSNSPQVEYQAPLSDAAKTTIEPPKEPFEVAILALQNLTLFPETVVPLGVGRPRSIAAVEAALSTPEKLLGCITVRPDRADDTDTRKDDLYDVG